MKLDSVKKCPVIECSKRLEAVSEFDRESLQMQLEASVHALYFAVSRCLHTVAAGFCLVVKIRHIDTVRACWQVFSEHCGEEFSEGLAALILDASRQWWRPSHLHRFVLSES